MTHGTPDGRQDSSVNFTIAFSTAVHQAQSLSQPLGIDRGEEVVQSSSKVLTFVISTLLGDIDSTSLSHHLWFQTLTSALPDCSGECWLCPSQVKLVTTICALAHHLTRVSHLTACSLL